MQKITVQCKCGITNILTYKKCRTEYYKNYRCKACAAKTRWENTSYRNSIIKSNKEVWANNHRRNKLSNKIKYIWAKNRLNYETRFTDSYKQKMSKNTKQLWNKEIYSKTKSKEFKNAVSDGLRKKWLDKEYRNKILTALNSPKRKKLMATAQANQPRVSSIQTILYSILDDLNIKYYREHEDKPNDPETIIGPYNFNCVIPRDGKPTLLIECQGDYWHSLDKAIRNDKSKSTYIEKYHPEYELKYLWEHEFYNKDRIIELLKYWLGIQTLHIKHFNFKDITIKYSKSSDYKLLLSKYHYLPNAGRGGKAIGAYLDDNLIAVAVFSPPVRQNISQQWDLKDNEIRELSRFCIHPKYQKKNFGSWFLSKCLKQLDHKLIVSYCDTTFNHDGALYKACNFKLDGEVKPDYWYVSEDGWVMHKKTLYGKARSLKMTEKEFATVYNYMKIHGKKKLKFIYSKELK